MALIGNDIISLKSPENQNSHNNERYLRKVFSEREIQYMHSEVIPNLSYMLWTCKEAAYKISLKQGIMNGFSPRLFQVELVQEHACGLKLITRYLNKQYYTNTYICPDFVQSIASDRKDALDRVRSHMISDYEYPQVSSDDLIAEYIEKDFGISRRYIQVSRIFLNIPHVTLNEAFGAFDVSISHDNNKTGLAILKV